MKVEDIEDAIGSLDDRMLAEALDAAGLTDGAGVNEDAVSLTQASQSVGAGSGRPAVPEGRGDTSAARSAAQTLPPAFAGGGRPGGRPYDPTCTVHVNSDTNTEASAEAEPAARERGAVRRPRVPFALAAAACVLAALLVAFAVTVPVAPNGGSGGGAGQPQGSSPARSEDASIPALTIPARDLAFADEGADDEDQPLYFVYQGECYVRKYECGDIAQGNVGKSLGTVREGDAESADELSGNVVGELHEVAGYDSAFLVCLVSGSGVGEQRHMYVRDNDLSFTTGVELFEDLLHLGASTRVRAVAHVDWRCGMDVSERSASVSETAVGAFLGALDAGALREEDAISQENGWPCLADAPLQRHLVFEADGGPSIPIHLYAPMSSFYDEDGVYYVCCDLLPQACAAISKADAAELIEALDAQEHVADQEDATAAYRVFIGDKEGYYRIITLRGASQPVLLVSKHRFDATGTVTGCTVYDYEAGYVRKVGKVQCTSSAYSVCAYDGRLYYGSHHYSAFVNPQDGRLSGEIYTEVFDDKGRTTYWRASLVDGEEGERERVGADEGEARMQAEDLLGALPVEFAAIP